jgi:hypothetical protein
MYIHGTLHIEWLHSAATILPFARAPFRHLMELFV